MTLKTTTLAAESTHEAFGQIHIEYLEDAVHVKAELEMALSLETLQTGIALDGSSSMRSVFGRLKRTPPREVFDDLYKRGMIERIVHDDKATYLPTEEAIEELKANGHWGSTDNVAEQEARALCSLLAQRGDGHTTAMYWACGDEGSDIEPLGVLQQEEIDSFVFRGPQRFGNGTRLHPALCHFSETFSSSEASLLVFVTDGELEDLAEVKEFSERLSSEVAEGKRAWFRFALLGLGREVNVDQLLELKDIDGNSWETHHAKETTALPGLLEKILENHLPSAKNGAVEDEQGSVVKQYTNGLPSSLEFVLPEGSTSFTLRIGENTFTQPLGES